MRTRRSLWAALGIALFIPAWGCGPSYPLKHPVGVSGVLPQDEAPPATNAATTQEHGRSEPDQLDEQSEAADEAAEDANDEATDGADEHHGLHAPVEGLPIPFAGARRAANASPPPLTTRASRPRMRPTRPRLTPRFEPPAPEPPAPEPPSSPDAGRAEPADDSDE